MKSSAKPSRAARRSRPRRLVVSCEHGGNAVPRGYSVLFALYDPRRGHERRLMKLWHDALRARAPELRVRRNYPYLGVSDSLVTYLRRMHPERAYAGVELEVNQKHVGTAAWPALVAALVESLAAVLREV